MQRLPDALAIHAMATRLTRDVPELRSDISCYHSHNLQQYASPYIGMRFQDEDSMCAEWKDAEGSDDLLRDPLIRLVMDSDGVTVEAMIGVMQQLRHALASRDRQARATYFGLGPDAKFGPDADYGPNADWLSRVSTADDHRGMSSRGTKIPGGWLLPLAHFW